MDEKVCTERHERIDARFRDYDGVLEKHRDDITGLKISGSKNETTIENVCKNLDGLTKAIWGLVLIVASSLIGFFIYAVQQGVFNKAMG